MDGWAFYPVEELFKLLNEQLHSAGFHCSAKRTVEELNRKENNHCYKIILFALWKAENAWQILKHTGTHLVHTVAFSYYCTINSVLQSREVMVSTTLNWKHSVKEIQMLISQYSQVFPLPDILLWEVYRLCLVSRSLGFEPPEGCIWNKNSR